MRIFVIVFFGGGASFFLGVICTHRVAFRVDASGVTLGGMPPRYRAQTRLIPWADIEKIILWKQQLPVAPPAIRGPDAPQGRSTAGQPSRKAPGRDHGAGLCAAGLTVPATLGLRVTSSGSGLGGRRCPRHRRGRRAGVL